MIVTKQQVKNMMSRYIEVRSVDRVGNKQLFVVNTEDNCLLVSYFTVIGVYDCGWKYTDMKHSVTTAHQLAKFSRMNGGLVIPHKDFADLVIEKFGLSPSDAEYLTDR